MSRKRPGLALQVAATLALLGSTTPLSAAEFSYEGRLDDRGVPASGRYDIRLVVYRDAESGAAMAAPITFPSVDVVEGKFRLQFDAPLAGSEPAWVELAVRDPGAKSFSVIPARTKAVLAPAVIGACWSSTGDAGSNPSVNFLGTTDEQALVLRTGDAQSLRIEPSSIAFNGKPITANLIAGSSANSVDAGVRGATISGGGVVAGIDPTIPSLGPNRVTDAYGTIGGGVQNQAGDGAGTASDRLFASVGGGRENLATGFGGTVGGGYGNQASDDYAAVGGGLLNFATNNDATVAGGEFNRASGAKSSVLGGDGNVAQGLGATVAGGIENCAGGNYSFAGGRRAKVRPSFNPGIGTGCDGVTSVGGAGDFGSFVWADSLDANFVSSGSDQFMIRAQGGVAINSAPTAGVELSLYGTAASAGFANIFLRQVETDRGGVLVSGGAASADNNNAGLYFDQYKTSGPNAGQLRIMELDNAGRLRVYVDGPIKPTSGSWSAPSDARLKHHVAPLQGSLDRLLALRGVTFEYNADAPSNYFVPGVHAGFVAQDVERVFPEWVSTDEDGYRLVGPQGFEALAVEALRELRDTNRELREEVAELRARLDSQGTAER